MRSSGIVHVSAKLYIKSKNFKESSSKAEVAPNYLLSVWRHSIPLLVRLDVSFFLIIALNDHEE